LLYWTYLRALLYCTYWQIEQLKSALLTLLTLLIFALLSLPTGKIEQLKSAVSGASKLRASLADSQAVRDQQARYIVELKKQINQARVGTASKRCVRPVSAKN